MTTRTLLPQEPHHDGPFYAINLDGKPIGTVESYFPTFERDSPSKRYSSKSWTSNRLYWRAVDVNGRTVAAPCRTRKEAIWALESNERPLYG